MSGRDTGCEPSSKSLKTEILALAVILLATWLIFGRACSHEFLNNWDDPRYVLRNEAIRGVSLANLKTIFTTFYVGNYAPVQMLSYMLDYSLWGLAAHGFIITNITLHACNGMLLYTLLKKLGSGPLPALFGALVFVSHPVQVESVVWISQRKNLLAMFFFLWSFHRYCDWRTARGRSPAASYGLSLLAFVLALLAKSVAVTLPLALLAYDWVYHPGERRRDMLVSKLPYLAVALLVGAVALVSQAPEAGGGRVPYHGGSLWTTALTMLPVLLRYLRLLVWPTSLSAIYDPPVKGAVDGEVLLGFAFFVLVAGTALFLLRRRSRNFLWVALIVTGLLPVSQIVPIITLMNDRYLYFPLIGIAGLCAGLGEQALAARAPGAGRLLGGAGGVVVVALAALAWGRVPVWKNSFRLWNDAVVKSPGSYTAWSGLGEAYHNDGRLDEAQYAYLRSLSLKPSNAEVVNNLGVLFLDRGETGMARQFLEPLLRDNPRDFSALLNLGDSYFIDNDLESAERYYAAAHDLRPAAPKPLAFLGGVALVRGDLSRANDYFTRAGNAGLEPKDLAFYRASILSRTGHAPEAIDQLQAAIRLGYDDFASMAWDRNFDPIRGSAAYRRLVPAPGTRR